jgi:hypothetical protein
MFQGFRDGDEFTTMNWSKIPTIYVLNFANERTQRRHGESKTQSQHGQFSLFSLLSDSSRFFGNCSSQNQVLLFYHVLKEDPAVVEV